ncbi:SURF1 family protein [Nocardioides alkalitolerans]|uniref:SURF1 family protein n=1 Tax=Nocardioides alkalitolerans TaxID=281714 RepID=UPI00040D755B|nr:SURF1 family protein [Nocardioides alkalitolerans]
MTSRLHPALRPKVWPFHVLGIAAVAVATSLGLWQHDAWQQHREMAAVDLSAQEPVPLAGVMTAGEPFPGDAVGLPVVVEGTWRPDLTLVVSDRRRDGDIGYWVVTPIAVPASETGDGDDPEDSDPSVVPGESGTLLPVVRGWSATADDLPAAPEGAVETVAWLQPGEGSGATDDDATDRVVPQMRLADVLRLVDGPMYEAYGVVAGPDAASGPVGEDPVNPGTDGLAPVTPDEVPAISASTGLRNLLYAIEWWVFAAFAAFVWWRFVKDEVDKARQPDDDGAPGPDLDAPDPATSPDPATASELVEDRRVPSGP